MNKYFSGLLAGLLATIILSVLMIIKSVFNIAPEFNVINDMNAFLNVDITVNISGWLTHFIIGVVIWGTLFAFFVNYLKGSYWFRGVLFSVLAWLLMMVVYMPVMGYGLFAKNLGGHIVVITLVMHLIYGYFLGLFYGKILKEQPNI